MRYFYDKGFPKLVETVPLEEQMATTESAQDKGSEKPIGPVSPEMLLVLSNSRTTFPNAFFPSSQK